MKNIDGKIWVTLSCKVVTVLLAAVCCVAPGFGGAVAKAQQVVIVQPEFGGQIQGYTIDPNGTEGLLSSTGNPKNPQPRI
jgi:hypothetical protein